MTPFCVGRKCLIIAYVHKEANSKIQKDESSAPFQTSSGAHTASYIRTARTCVGVKRPGCGINQAPPSKCQRVKERVKLYLYSLSVPLWQCIG